MMLTAAVILKQDRLEDLTREQAKLRKVKYSNQPILQSLEEARRDQGITRAKTEIRDEIKGVAAEMVSGGVPTGVWIRYPREQARDVMLYLSNDDPPKLSTTDYTGPP